MSHFRYRKSLRISIIGPAFGNNQESIKLFALNFLNSVMRKYIRKKVVNKFMSDAI